MYYTIYLYIILLLYIYIFILLYSHCYIMSHIIIYIYNYINIYKMYSPVNFNSPVNQVQFACHRKKRKIQKI